jgi:CubicO group peptidase (beta-lactamase class C family)
MIASPFLRVIVWGVVSAALAAGALTARTAAQDAAPPLTAQVDALFADFTTSSPGCAVGASVDGRVVVERAYGMADLEHDAVNRPDTIFEAGSVSKQFTAAAVLLLAEDGAISLDDPVRKHVPELPAVADPITIRHLLTHTSGLRDWGSLAGISGWPRTSRVHTHAHVVDILSRQQALNFAPGTRWSYSNSGYNLSAVIVDRASGMSFAEFSRTRVFEPMGMMDTSWRDDYRRIVPNRAVAYSGGGNGGYRLNMPFEQVHGNGGLLTTVGDLLRWNNRFLPAAAPANGRPSFVAAQQEPARLADGRALHYAFGLFVEPYRGRPEVYHSGSTAGYRAFLTWFPDERVSVAVLCNGSGGNATQLAHGTAELLLPELEAGGRARPARLPESAGPTAGLERDDAWRPTPAQLAEFAGIYVSDEIETTLTLEVRDDALVALRRPDDEIRLRPHSADRFQAGGGLGLVTFHRRDGRVVELGVAQDRVWDLRFTRRRE